MESVLASSAVWYNSRAADAKDGLIAFASRNVVYLLNSKDKFPKYSSILRGHTERISSCSFCHSKRNDDSIALVSGSDDCTVKLWNVTLGSLLQEHDLHSPNRVTAVHWSPVNSETVLSVDEKGFLVHWNLATNKKTKYQPEGANHQPLTCVTCSPFNENLVALGYKSGGASIVDLSLKCRIIAKMRGHSNEINSLIWPCLESDDLVGINSSLGNALPESEDSLSDQQAHFQKEVIITGSKDRSIKIWSTSGKCIRTYRLVSKSAKGRRIPEESSRIFVALLWPTGSKSTFLSSSFNGDILLWDINNDPKEPPVSLGSNDLDDNHSRLVFNLVCDANSQNVFSFSMDRWIKCWNINKPLSPPEWSQPTLGGFVYAIAASPCNPSVIALGIGDGMIRLWNTQNPRDPFDVKLLWQCVKEKVMSLSWHPSKEGLLGFGTEDGKVGLFDTLSMKQPIISTTYHLRPVYSMSWGPSLDSTSDGDDELCLYTCGGDGKVYVHHLSRKNDSSAIELNQLLRNANAHVDFYTTGRHSEIAWKPDLTVLAIGNDNGLIQIFKYPDLMNIINVKVHGKIINCLSWGVKSEHDTVDTSYWMASGSNGFDVHVSDLKEAMNQNVSSEAELPVLINNSFRHLSGHHSRVTSLSWSAKNPFLLASASYDGTAQVWNVLNEEPLANYRGHDGRLLCVSWNNVSTDNENGIIYSGGDDYAVHAWTMEKQEHKFPPVQALTSYSNSKYNSKKKNRSRKKKVVQQSSGDGSGTARNGVFVENVYKESGDNSMAELEMKKLELLKELDLGDGSTDKQPVSTNATEGASNSKKIDETISSNDAGDSGIEPHDGNNNIKDVLADLSQQRLKAAETEKRRVRLKNLFPLSVSQDNKKKTEIQQDCVNIVRYLVTSSSDDAKPDTDAAASGKSDIDPGFFGNRLSTFKMLFCEERNHVKNNDIDAMNVLKLFRGDIVSAVAYAIENNCMSRSLVSFSPMAGFDVWQRACLAYAEQLTRDGASLHAAQYFVCCNQVKRAITMLCDNKHYREAVVLARTHLLDDDPFLIETVMTWAAKLKYGGSYDLAAKCYASVGEYEKAASSISHYATLKPIPGPNEINAYLAAMSVCKTAGLQDLYLDYGRRALTSILLNNVWKDTHDASGEFFKDYAAALQLIVCVHEILLRYDSAHEKRLKSIHIDFAKESLEIALDTTDLLPAIMASWDRLVGINSSTSAEKILDIRTDVVSWASDKNISTTNLAIKNTVLQTSIQLSAVLIEQLAKQQSCAENTENELPSVNNAYCDIIRELSSGIAMSDDEKHYLGFILDQAVSCSNGEIVL